MIQASKYPNSKTKELFRKIAHIAYICGLPNFWIEELNLPKSFIRVYDKIVRIFNVATYFFLGIEIAAHFTQHHLTNKQNFDLLLYSISHPILNGYGVIVSRQVENVRKVLLDLIVNLKVQYNDPVIEEAMIKISMTYSVSLITNCVLSMLTYTFDALLMVYKKGVTFNVIITAWPDVEDTSTEASIGRIGFHIFWWLFVTRPFAVYVLVINLTTCLSHQYMNLQSYFHNLEDIFKENLSQNEKEAKYEAEYKIGVMLHANTLRCTRRCHMVWNGVMSGQIIFNISLIVIIMAQMMNSDRTLVNTFGTVLTASAILISTGFFMWNAGDVTVQASRLATAMYCSGWQNCRGKSSVSIRNMVMNTIAVAQRPLVLRGLGVIDLSYQSYLSIVKASYTVFSVIY